MAEHFSTLMRCLFVQIAVLAVCSAYPYFLEPDYEESDVVRRIDKRAFDRLDSNEFGLIKRAFDKRSFDRLDMADFGLRRKRAFDRIARADFGLNGFRRKRSLDRNPMEYGLRRKRAFDRISGSEFGLIKRSVDYYPSREELISDLADSIAALRQEAALRRTTPVLVAAPLEEQELNN